MLRAILQHALVAWRSGVRSRSFQAISIVGLLAMLAVLGAAEFSGRQPATVALDVAISVIRFVGLLLVLFWCQELVAKDVERKTVFLALSYPAPRASFILGRYLGIVTLMIAAVLLLGGLAFGAAKIAASSYQQASRIDLGAGLLTSIAFIALDLAVIAAFATLLATFSTTPFLPLLLGLAFALAARSLGPTLEFLASGTEAAKGLDQQMSPALDTIQYLLPDLSRLDVRVLALYPDGPGAVFLVQPAAMAICYILLCLSGAAWQFYRREFS